jgi:hypothetical protein
MKPMTLLFLAMLASFAAMTQTDAKTDSFFIKAIDSVLLDFPNNLRNISGEAILSQGEVDHFASRVFLPGAETCIITRYHSTEDTTASWQARMYHHEDFDKAASQYHELFHLLKSCYARLEDGSILRLQGEWEPAREENAFTSSSFHLPTVLWKYRKVQVDIELLYQLSDWVVNINIISKERDDKDWSK